MSSSIPIVISVIALILSLWTYFQNGRVNRARFLLDLHRDFFVGSAYMEMRKCLDTPADSECVRKAVDDQEEEFTNFLNFFELVAYYQRHKLLTRRDVDALLGYYLDRLDRHLTVVKYVRDERTSFEHLAWLLEKRRAQSHA